jgi:hypothetical protein
LSTDQEEDGQYYEKFMHGLGPIAGREKKKIIWNLINNNPLIREGYQLRDEAKKLHMRYEKLRKEGLPGERYLEEAEKKLMKIEEILKRFGEMLEPTKS